MLPFRVTLSSVLLPLGPPCPPTTGTGPTTKGSGGKGAAPKYKQHPKGQAQSPPRQLAQGQGAPRQLFGKDLAKVLNATIGTIDTPSTNPDEVAERSWRSLECIRGVAP